MSPARGDLAGRGVLVTRPAGQAGPLARRITEAGGRPVLFPSLEIVPPSDPAAFERALARLPTCQHAVFVSPTCVALAWPAIHARHGGWPTGVAAAAVGHATARALAEVGVTGVRVSAEGADSEHLLALPEFTQVAGEQVIIFRGEGGRELIADTLRQRGAEVTYAECYRRVCPEVDASPLRAEWRAGGIAAVTVTSREIFAHLVRLLGPEGADLLRATPLFAPHPRIVDAARAWGVAHAVTTAPGDAGLVAGLRDWFNPGHD
ncbi:MAG: uroporphyrinogen-III synthase [Pseudomonadota bacterium]